MGPGVPKRRHQLYLWSQLCDRRRRLPAKHHHICEWGLGFGVLGFGVSGERVCKQKRPISLPEAYLFPSWALFHSLTLSKFSDPAHSLSLLYACGLARWPTCPCSFSGSRSSSARPKSHPRQVRRGAPKRMDNRSAFPGGGVLSPEESIPIPDGNPFPHFEIRELTGIQDACPQALEPRHENPQHETLS